MALSRCFEISTHLSIDVQDGVFGFRWFAIERFVPSQQRQVLQKKGNPCMGKGRDHDVTEISGSTPDLSLGVKLTIEVCQKTTLSKGSEAHLMFAFTLLPSEFSHKPSRLSALSARSLRKVSRRTVQAQFAIRVSGNT
jgi:hypothetical protein